MTKEGFFRKRVEVYISIDTAGVERRDAEPFVAFDTNMPYVKPLYTDGGREEFEIFERGTVEQLVREEYVLNYEEIEVETLTPEVSMPVKLTLLLPAPKAQKLLMAGKQPLLLPAPDKLEQIIEELALTEAPEVQHVIYFSDIEFKDGAEMITESKTEREKQRSFVGAKIMAFVFMMVGLASILFPSISLKAAKMEYTVNPTNTTPGLSFSIDSGDMTIQDGRGILPFQTQANQLSTSTLNLDVSTTGADGYKMYVTTEGKDKKGAYTSALVNKDTNANNGEGAKINSLSSDTAMSAFPAGYWGYATDSSLQSSTLFKPFPIYDATDTTKYGGSEIASANTAIADDDAAGETPFTIGIKTDSNLPAGRYENELLFTVIANPVTVTYNLNFDGNTTDSSLAGMPATITEHTADVFTNIAIPNAEPTRDGYIFLGWADSPSATEPDYLYGDATKGEVTLQVTDINNSQTVDKTVYAVWKEKDWMQDFDADSELTNVGDTKILWDKRDDTTYTVKRLADGNVWMTQNLKLNGARTLTPADSDVTSNFSMPASIPYSSWCSGSNCYNTAQVYYDATRESYGPLYSWAAATAGRGTEAITSGNVVSSICPKGWRLPTSGAGGEYSALDIALGGSGVNRSNVPADLAVYESVAGFDYPGAINSTLTVVGEYGRWWSSAAGNSSSAYYLYLDARSDQKAIYPYMLNAKYFGGSVRCVARSSTNDNTKYMQDFNDAIDLRTVGNATTYVDRRDGKDYTVARLADGKVWMTQNIDYEAQASKRNEYGSYYLRSNADSVCPTGWHLPSTAEFVALDRSYGGLGTGRNANAASYSSYVGLPFNWAMSGFYRTVDTQYGATGWDQVGKNGYYMESDVNTVHTGNVMTANIVPETKTVWMDANTTGSTYATAIRCIGDQPNVYYIQDFNGNTMLPNANDSAILTDRRDGETYRVTRLADGNVWMTQNLRLKLTAGETLTAANTDAPANGLQVDYTTRTSGGVAWDASTVRSYDSGVSDYGVYYNWYAATAGTKSTEYSICPSGWRLPSSTEYATLISTYSFNQTTVRNAPFYMATSDHYDPKGTPYNRGTLGHLWTSTANGSNAYFMFFNASTINNASQHDQSYGFAVRCVAREDAKVSFDANGGTGVMAMQNFTGGIQQNISANTFTRAGYNFIGWALTANATTAKYTDGQAAVFNKSTTLYAVWEADYMQDFDAKSRIPNAGDSVTLIDKRDNVVYTAKRLPDGKVWMTQNLRYTGSTDLGTSSTSTGSFAIDATNSEGSGSVSFVSSFSSTTSAQYVKYNGNTTYGAYYNWFAALNVCPAGWHLPSSSEQVSMDIAYGGSGQTRTDATMYANYQLATDNWPGMVRAGYYHDNVFETALGLYWSSTAYGSTYTSNDSAKFFYLAGNNQILPDYVYAKWFGRSVRCVANESETVSFNANGGSGTMADVTVEKGENVTLTNGFTNPAYTFDGWATSADGAVVYTDGQVISVNEDIVLYALWTPKGDFIQDFDQDTELLTIGETKTLYDERDGKTYTVKRLADGKVWMTQNLGLVGPITLTPADSNVTSDFTLEASSNATSGWCKISGSTEQSCINQQQTYYDPSNPDDGALYNWYTATAGAGTYSVTSGSVNVDICPKGWHMPTGGSNSEIVALDKAYGYSGSSRTNATQAANYKSSTGNWPNFMPFKYISASNGTLETSAIFIQSSTAKSNTTRYVFYLDNTNSIQPTRDSLKGPQAVRCIADYTEHTVSFNANGGSGTMANQTIVNGQTVALPTNTFTRSGYNFLGWATSAGTNTVTYTDGQTITPTEDMMLYAVWYKPMANFNCTSISMGSSIQLYDERDGNFYNVTRVPSGNGDFVGKCFMNEDLRYGDTFASTHSTGDTFSGMRYVKYSESSSWSHTDSMSNKQFTITNINGTNVGYYSFPTVGSVCPAGWSAPTQEQYKSLITTYGSGTSGINTLTSASGPFKLSRNGVFYNGTEGWLSNVFNYWTSSPSTQYAYYFRIGRSGTMEVGSDGGLYVGHPVRCMK